MWPTACHAARPARPAASPARVIQVQVQVRSIISGVDGLRALTQQLLLQLQHTSSVRRCRRRTSGRIRGSSSAHAAQTAALTCRAGARACAQIPSWLTSSSVRACLLVASWLCHLHVRADKTGALAAQWQQPSAVTKADRAEWQDQSHSSGGKFLVSTQGIPRADGRSAG